KEILERFKREAEAAASLRHTAIVAVYDFVEENGVSYIVLEYVEGTDLDTQMADGAPLDFTFAVRVLAECAEALDYAHARNIVHRDIKPSNVMIEKSGAARVMDFGIAKRLGSDSETDITQGAIVGTWKYMAREQFSGEAVDGRTDQYSLAVV